MSACETCNTDNLEGSQYCDECGAPLRVASSLKRNARAGQNGVGSDATDVIVPARGSAKVPAVSEFSPKNRLPAFAVSSQSPIPPDRKAHSVIIIERGGSTGKEFLLTGEESQIGRWDADGGVFPDIDLDADDPEAKVSRRHARIVWRNGQYSIEDLGSTNGTFINRGRRLLPGDSQPLRDGDEIIVGKTFLRFKLVN